MLDYISLWGISKCGDREKIKIKTDLGSKINNVFVCPTELFLLMACFASFKSIPDTKYNLIHKYDHYIKLFDKYYSCTLFSVMIFMLCRVVLSAEFFFDLAKSKCGGKCNPKWKPNITLVLFQFYYNRKLYNSVDKYWFLMWTHCFDG